MKKTHKCIFPSLFYVSVPNLEMPQQNSSPKTIQSGPRDSFGPSMILYINNKHNPQILHKNYSNYHWELCQYNPSVHGENNSIHFLLINSEILLFIFTGDFALMNL